MLDSDLYLADIWSTCLGFNSYIRHKNRVPRIGESHRGRSFARSFRGRNRSIVNRPNFLILRHKYPILGNFWPFSSPSEAACRTLPPNFRFGAQTGTSRALSLDAPQPRCRPKIGIFRAHFGDKWADLVPWPSGCRSPAKTVGALFWRENALRGRRWRWHKVDAAAAVWRHK